MAKVKVVSQFAGSLAWLSVAGTASFGASVAAMQIIQPELSTVDDAVSYYMNGRLGWILGAGLVMIGIGSLALMRAIQMTFGSALGRWGVWCLAAWGIGAAIGGLFPPDPRGHWREPSSVSGMIHANVAMVAFLAFPIAAVLLSRVMGSGALRWLAYGSGLSLLAFFVCLAPVFLHRAPHYLGLAERVVLAVYMAWLVLAALVVRRESRTGALQKA
ncbi:MAG: DUF998 domain-containing protein [Acidobacteria bacterium]|nr:DUF998 domain-containing protein [Acidobacteriota bacterium]